MDNTDKLVRIPAGDATLEGSLILPEHAVGVVLFAHGSGSSRHSPRNIYVAGMLQKHGFGTLLIDLLTFQEDLDYGQRFDIDLLVERLIDTTKWLQKQDGTKSLPLGLFGASTGAAAAIQAAAILGGQVCAVVSRGGRPDLAWRYLDQIKAPTLLIVGGNDDLVIQLNQQAYEKINAEKQMRIVPGATHLFEEPGALEEVAELAAGWFEKWSVRGDG